MRSMIISNFCVPYLNRSCNRIDHKRVFIIFITTEHLLKWNHKLSINRSFSYISTWFWLNSIAERKFSSIEKQTQNSECAECWYVSLFSDEPCLKIMRSFWSSIIGSMYHPHDSRLSQLSLKLLFSSLSLMNLEHIHFLMEIFQSELKL